MKIAALISGEPRFCKEHDVFLSNMHNYSSIDWYYALWDKNYESDHRFHGNIVSPLMQTITPLSAQDIQKRLPSQNTVAALEVLDKSKNELPFSIKNKASETNARNTWFMFSSMYKANQLRQNTNIKYDMVMRTRPDISMSSLDFVKVYNLLCQHPNSIVLPNNDWFGHNGWVINDFLAIGTPDVMNKYFDVVHYIKQVVETEQLYHPESMLHLHCKQEGINLIRGGFEATLRRLGTYVNGKYQSDFGTWV